jgi:hypothetical protein
LRWLLVFGLAGTLAAPVLPAAALAHGGVDMCTIHNRRVVELSGLAVTGNGYVAINDSNRDRQAMRIFYFDKRCQLIRSVGYPASPLDPEDMEVTRNGTLWVADIGDNSYTTRNRLRHSVIALWKFPPYGRPSVHRLAYPDGRHNAEALLLNGDGTPIIVTKERSGTARLYLATDRHTRAGVYLLRRVGSFTPHPSRWTRWGPRAMVTGGANSLDGTKVALRTYTRAYEWDVHDGDVVGAITGSAPRVTSLLGEPAGEAIAYNHSGTAFFTVGDQEGPTTVRRYAPNESRASYQPHESFRPRDSFRPVGPYWPYWPYRPY